jgi:uncharacterized membrane protein YfcA
MTSFTVLAFVAGVFLVAGFVKGVIGMGLPTVAVGLLGLMMTPSRAAAIIVVPSLVTNVWQAVAGDGFAAAVRRLWPMFVGICIGSWAGAVWLPDGSSGDATIWLGVALAVYATFGLANLHLRVPKRHERSIGLLVGIATGAVTVATGVFSIPGVPFIQALNLERDRLVQALGLSFTVSTLTLAGALQHAGEMKISVVVPSMAALAAALAGVLLGQVIRGRASPATFRLCFFIGLLALGAHLALRGLF